MAAIFNFIIGSIMGPSTPQQISEGFIGFSSKFLFKYNKKMSINTIKMHYFIPKAEVFQSNWGPDYRFSEKLDQSFFSVFAIFFPSG